MGSSQSSSAKVCGQHRASRTVGGKLVPSLPAELQPAVGGRRDSLRTPSASSSIIPSSNPRVCW